MLAPAPATGAPARVSGGCRMAARRLAVSRIGRFLLTGTLVVVSAACSSRQATSVGSATISTPRRRASSYSSGMIGS